MAQVAAAVDQQEGEFTVTLNTPDCAVQQVFVDGSEAKGLRVQRAKSKPVGSWHHGCGSRRWLVIGPSDIVEALSELDCVQTVRPNNGKG